MVSEKRVLLCTCSLRPWAKAITSMTTNAPQTLWKKLEPQQSTHQHIDRVLVFISTAYTTPEKIMLLLKTTVFKIYFYDGLYSVNTRYTLESGTILKFDICSCGITHSDSCCEFPCCVVALVSLLSFAHGASFQYYGYVMWCHQMWTKSAK